MQNYASRSLKDRRLQISGVSGVNEARGISGVQAGLGENNALYVNGVQLSFGYNKLGDSKDGSGYLRGAQVGGANFDYSNGGTGYGFQLGLIGNIVVKGNNDRSRIQVGLFNSMSKQKGIQVGVINHNERGDTVSIGPINYVSEGAWYQRFRLIVSWHKPKKGVVDLQKQIEDFINGIDDIDKI